MSAKTVYTCDHCGASVSPYIGEQWAAMISTVGPSIPGVHGCSKEHLGLALAKIFELPVNVDVAHLQSEANAKGARIIELETAWDMLKKSLDESDLQRRELLARLQEWEAWKERLCTKDTEHGLGVVRPPFAGNDHPHEVGSCSYCDTPTPKADAIKLAREVRDAAQSAYAAAGITDPTKPTKPVDQ